MSYDRLFKDIRRDSAARITSDINQKEKMESYVRPDKRDNSIYLRGLDWYNSGLPLEDAPEEVRNNTNFINGFNKGKRLSYIASLQKKNSGHSR